MSPDRIAPIDAIRRFKGQVFVIGGSDDRFTPQEETKALVDAAPGAKQLWIVPGLDHAALSAVSSDYYRQRTLSFFTSCLRD